MMRFWLVLVALVPLTAAAMFVTAASGGRAQSSDAKVGLNCGFGITAQLVPLVIHDSAGHVISPATYNFKAVCEQHDACYARWGSDRGSCDQAFGLNMQAECQRQSATTRSGCQYVAEEYHSAVVRSGLAAYTHAQTQAVDAAFDGSYRGVGSVTLTGDPKAKPVQWASGGLPEVFVGGPPPTVEAGSPLRITTSGLTATAIANGSPETPCCPGITVTYAFHYALNGTATVKGTFGGHGIDQNGVAVVYAGSISATKSSSG